MHGVRQYVHNATSAVVRLPQKWILPETDETVTRLKEAWAFFVIPNCLQQPDAWVFHLWQDALRTQLTDCFGSGILVF